ncbi:MAG: ComEC/Rec2 family competence protein, partial [Chloroflexi bacterium]|nr:ComEC/Rec2 family competence protein [Chloroflexota bacterium]
MRLVYLSLAWVLGIYVGSRCEPHWAILSILIALSALAAILFRRKKALVWGALCLVLLFGGILRFTSVSEGDALSSYRGFHELRGVVAADPDLRESSTALRIEAREIRKPNGEWESVAGTVQVYAPQYPSLSDSRDFPYYRYGDLLQMMGALESPDPPGEGEDFDFREYLARKGIYSVMYEPREVSLLDSGEKSEFMGWVYRLRGTLSRSLDEALPEPQCSLAKAMAFGERGSISQEVKDDFQRSGLTHILSISGLHVTIVAGLALAAGAWVFGRKRPTYLIVALALVWFYVLLSGMSPPAIRAAIMGSLWLYGDWLGRPKSAFVALTFAAAIMLAFDPQLLSDLGFRLSFAAMAGLVFLTPVFQDWGRRVLGKREEIPSALNFVIASFAMSTGAVLATLPLIAYHFHSISMMSLPSTLVTLPAIPGLIVSSALVGAVGVFAAGVASVLGWTSWLFATYVLKAAEVFAAVPGASVSVEMSAPAVWAYYGILVVALWLPKNRGRLREGIPEVKKYVKAMPGLAARVPPKWIVLPLIVIAALVWTAALTVSDSKLHIYVLDVGQGDSLLLQKGNEQIIIDGGPSAEKLSDQLGGKLPYWDRTIELVVLTHPDSDHLTGLLEVLRRYEVKKVLTGGQEADSELYAQWRKLLNEEGAEEVIARAGGRISMGGGIELTVVYPE